MENEIYELNSEKKELEKKIAEKGREYLKLERMYEEAMETIDNQN